MESLQTLLGKVDFESALEKYIEKFGGSPDIFGMPEEQAARLMMVAVRSNRPMTVPGEDVVT